MDYGYMQDLDRDDIWARIRGEVVSRLHKNEHYILYVSSESHPSNFRKIIDFCKPRYQETSQAIYQGLKVDTYFREGVRICISTIDLLGDNERIAYFLRSDLHRIFPQYIMAFESKNTIGDMGHILTLEQFNSMNRIERKGMSNYDLQAFVSDKSSVVSYFDAIFGKYGIHANVLNVRKVGNGTIVDIRFGKPDCKCSIKFKPNNDCTCDVYAEVNDIEDFSKEVARDSFLGKFDLVSDIANSIVAYHNNYFGGYQVGTGEELGLG